MKLILAQITMVMLFTGCSHVQTVSFESHDFGRKIASTPFEDKGCIGQSCIASTDQYEHGWKYVRKDGQIAGEGMGN